MSVVIFNASAFREEYPQFAGLTDGRLANLWETATAMIDNSDASIIPYEPTEGVYKRKIILESLVCHLATLSQMQNNGQTGAVQSASEGSVSTSFAIPQVGSSSALAQWYNQTMCGRTVLMLLRPYSLGGRCYNVRYLHPFG